METETPTGTRGRRLLVVGAITVAAVAVVAVGLLNGSEDAAGDGAAFVCEGAGGAGTGSAGPQGGLAPEPAPDQLPPAVLCGFGEGAEPVAVADLLGGRPLVVNFWATWCDPCIREMPDFQRVHEAAGDAFRLVGINTQDALVNAVPFVEETGVTYELLSDPRGVYFNQVNGFGMPTTLFVDPDGTVRYRQTGPLDAEQMAELLAEHLGVEVAL